LVWSISWRFAVFLGLWGVLLAPAVIPRTWLHSLGERNPASLRFYFDVVGLLSLLVAGWVMKRWVDRLTPDFKWSSRSNPWTDFTWGLVGGLGWLAASVGMIGLLGGLHFALGGNFTMSVLGLAVISLLLNATVQEVLGRGYIFELMRRRAGPGWAVLISAASFTLIHAAAFRGNLWPMLNVFLAGVLFSLIRLRTGGLATAIGVHYAWNLLVGPILGLAVSGRDLSDGWRLLQLQGPDWLTGGAFGIEGSMVVTLLTTIICLAVGFLGCRKSFRAAHVASAVHWRRHRLNLGSSRPRRTWD